MPTAQSLANRFPNRLFLLLLGAAIALLYAPVFPAWLHDLQHDANYSHGLLIPFVAAYLLYQRRTELATCHRAPWWPGLLLLLAALAIYILGRVGAELFSQRVSLIVLVYGLTLYLFGRPLARVMRLPLFLLFFAIPLPYILYNAVAFPLKLIATKIAVQLISVIGIPVFAEGNVIHLTHTTLEVVDACSGIRSLMTLITLAFLVACFLLPRLWQQGLLILLALPITVLANAFRVAFTAMVTRYNPAWGEGFWHDFTGWLVFVGSFAALAGIAQILKKIGRQRQSCQPQGLRNHNQRLPQQQQNPSTITWLLPVVCMSLAAFLAHQAQAVQPTNLIRPLTDFPSRIGSYHKINEIHFSDQVVKAAGMDSYLMWNYAGPNGTVLGLYIGYYRDQVEGQLIHSPKHCMPGSGWSPIAEKKATLINPETQRPSTVTQYVLQKGMDKQLVHFWYQGRGRIIAGEYQDRALMIWDSMTKHRSDGALVRITGPGNNLEKDMLRQQEFIQALLPVLEQFLPQ